MANTGRPNSGGSQFFINVANNANLDWFSPGQSKHPVFGKVVDGMDLATKISKVKTVRDNPVQPIKMLKITIEASRVRRTRSEARSGAHRRSFAMAGCTCTV